MTGIDSRRHIKISLDYFADLPDNERPDFTFRRLNGAEYLAMLADSDAAYNSDDADSGAAAAYKAVSVGMVDWSNQVNPANDEAIPFDLGRIREVLNPDEALALVQKRAGHARLNGFAKKNFASPST